MHNFSNRIMSRCRGDATRPYPTPPAPAMQSTTIQAAWSRRQDSSEGLWNQTQARLDDLEYRYRTAGLLPQHSTSLSTSLHHALFVSQERLLACQYYCVTQRFEMGVTGRSV